MTDRLSTQLSFTEISTYNLILAKSIPFFVSILLIFYISFIESIHLL